VEVIKTKNSADSRAFHYESSLTMYNLLLSKSNIANTKLTEPLSSRHYGKSKVRTKMGCYSDFNQ
jgi:hypothetical protein